MTRKEKPIPPVTVAGESIEFNQARHLQYQQELREYFASLAQIFLSYARPDQEFAEQLFNLLKESNFNPWMDIHNIIGGEDWQRAIYTAIAESEIFVAVLSRNSVTRRDVIQKELKKALDKWEGMLPDDIYIIPLRIDDCPIPELLKDLQVIDWDGGDGLDKLFAAINKGLKRRYGSDRILEEDSPQAPSPETSRPISPVTDRVEEPAKKKFTEFIKVNGGIIGIFVGIIAVIGVLLQFIDSPSIQAIFADPTFTKTVTATATPTDTATPTSSITPSPSATLTSSTTITSTQTTTPTPLATATPTNTATATETITPSTTATATPTEDPYPFRGLDTGCFDKTYWYANSDLDTVHGKCLDVSEWFIMTEPYKIEILVPDNKLDTTVTRYLNVPIKKTSNISFEVKIDRLASLDDEQDGLLAFGIGVPDRSALRSSGIGEFLIFRKNPTDTYMEFGSGIYGIELYERDSYELGDEYSVRIEVNQISVKVFIDDFLFAETTIESTNLYFWILYQLPASGGELFATITDFRIDE